MTKMNDIWQRQHKKARDSVQFSRSVVSNSLQPQGLQHTRPLCPSPAPGVYSNSCPLNRSVMPSNHFIFCCPLLLPPSIIPSIRVFQMSQFFTWGGQSTGVSASTSVLPLNIQDLSPLGWTGWISLQSKGQFKSIRSTENSGIKIRQNVVQKF